MEKILNKIKKFIPVKLFKALQPAYHFLMSALAGACYGFPSNKLIVVGVTGTTGKTTSTYLIAKTLEAAGYRTGFTSTAMFNDGQTEWLNDKKMTMVGRFFTQKILRDMVRNGCRYAVVETTSEGVRQFRHRFINYDIVVITGLYPEHIESHGSFENYKAAKGQLFAHLKKCAPKYIDDNKMVKQPKTGIGKIELNKLKKTIIVNKDDEHAEYFSSFWAEHKIVFGVAENDTEEFNCQQDWQEVIASRAKVTHDGLEFSLLGEKIKTNLYGEFNTYNALIAASVALSQCVDINTIKEGLGRITGVAGRLEKINEGQDFLLIVDYAFEPHAVTKLYDSIALMPHNRVIHVLGSAGGGRDVSRRPILGKIAGERADFVIVTNEDPYDDDPQIIIDQVAIGAEHAGKKLGETLFKPMDRRMAIRQAIALANTGDIVIITGKGNEQAICVANGERIPWDDRQVAREELKLANK